MIPRETLPLEFAATSPSPAPAPKVKRIGRPALRPVHVGTPSALPTATRRKSVWLAVHLHGWQLHATLMKLPSEERAALIEKPLAVVDDDRKATLVACNAIAHARGVRVGHSLNAAIALCADMQFLRRQPTAEIELLERVAYDCEKYTSFVSIEPPNELLLEVRGSFRLFGGIEGLLKVVSDDFAQRGLTAQFALAPTPQSALWFSRAARQPILVKPRELIPAIARLPVSFLLWPPDVELRLARFGVLTLGDLLRLPRGGVGRRIGYERLAELDFAVGRHKQVRKAHHNSQMYSDRVLLDFEIETTGLLSTIIETRLSRLARFLAKRTLATDCVHIDLLHRSTAITKVAIGLAAPTSDVAHIVKLMHEKLAQLVLPEPVREAVIRVERLQPQPAESRDLFARTAHAPAIANTEPQARLLEQLRSRFGEQGIRQIAPVADHRPECANDLEQAVVTTAHDAIDLPAQLAPRPLWLLAAPRSIRSSSRLAASIVSGPEMIDCGWWDGAPVDREYYVARSSRGARAWIYRDRASSQVFVHGLFG
jgi:protein ImuB